MHGYRLTFTAQQHTLIIIIMHPHVLYCGSYGVFPPKDLIEKDQLTKTPAFYFCASGCLDSTTSTSAKEYCAARGACSDCFWTVYKKNATFRSPFEYSTA